MHLSDPRGDPEGGKLPACFPAHSIAPCKPGSLPVMPTHDRTLLPIHLFCFLEIAMADWHLQKAALTPSSLSETKAAFLLCHDNASD